MEPLTQRESLPATIVWRDSYPQCCRAGSLGDDRESVSTSLAPPDSDLSRPILLLPWQGFLRLCPHSSLDHSDVIGACCRCAARRKVGTDLHRHGASRAHISLPVEGIAGIGDRIGRHGHRGCRICHARRARRASARRQRRAADAAGCADERLAGENHRPTDSAVHELICSVCGKAIFRSRPTEIAPAHSLYVIGQLDKSCPCHLRCGTCRGWPVSQFCERLGVCQWKDRSTYPGLIEIARSRESQQLESMKTLRHRRE